ncbi:hypothetical protein RCO28_02765 [Streptomyces sp. LHD-70]|nr:hypothetical protein [Streptomyces sp. LHD-70]MDQ8701412.1 hypothetical protein [Streptomyces sp. LHD-70]
MTMRRPAELARAEWGALLAAVRTALAARKWRAVPLALGAVCLTSLLQYVQNQDWGYRFVQNIGAVRAEDPLWLALLRTPQSLFVPALDLPVWGALAQILLVFGIAEICVGRVRTLVVGYAATLAGTLYARVGVALGPGHPLGLPASDAQVVDTGPSAAVVGLAVYVCWRYRACFTAGLVVALMVVEVVVKDNLAGREHLAAIALVIVVCGVAELRQPSSGGRRSSVPPDRESGPPDRESVPPDRESGPPDRESGPPSDGPGPGSGSGRPPMRS